MAKPSKPNTPPANSAASKPVASKPGAAKPAAPAPAAAKPAAAPAKPAAKPAAAAPKPAPAKAETKPAPKPQAAPPAGPTGTVRLHRVLRAPPAKVYKAFLDAQALVKWMAPHGFTAAVHHIEPKVGGTYKMSFTNFGTGQSHSFGGTYLELKPGERLRYVDRFDDPNMPGEMKITIDLKKCLVGTDLSIVQEGIPAMIPVEFCYAGWQESLMLLAHVVEPDIPAQS